MSRHEGVSCDSCLKGNFRGRRYKCLVCYDYDLCGACYDSGAITTRHTIEHPMQCILTRNDLELYYEGEGLEQQQAFTCPFCGKMGFTESALHEHVTADHTVSTFEVVCPICAAQPGGDPNLITDDFASHLSLEHRSGPRDLISFLDEPSSGSRHSVRRIPHPTRGVGSSRNRNRTNMHFSSAGNATSSLSTRDTVDPIAELLSQLSGVRRSTGSNSSSSQIAHIQMQLQLERQQVRAARQQLERLPRRQNQSSSSGAGHAGSASANSHSNALGSANSESTASGGQKQHEFLLSKTLSESITEQEKSKQDQEKLRRLVYVHSVLLGSLRAGMKLGPNPNIAELLPQLKRLRVTSPEAPPPSSSDEKGVTNICVGGGDDGCKQVPDPSNSVTLNVSKSTVKSSSLSPAVSPSPTPSTQRISISPPTTAVTNPTASDVKTVTPSRAKILLAKKLVSNSRPTDIASIRKMVAAKSKTDQIKSELTAGMTRSTSQLSHH